MSFAVTYHYQMGILVIELYLEVYLKQKKKQNIIAETNLDKYLILLSSEQ